MAFVVGNIFIVAALEFIANIVFSALQY